MAETCENKELETPSHCNSTTSLNSNLPTEINSKRVPNIIMLGPTGAGKSFFGNGLFGVEKPEEGKINISDPLRPITERQTLYNLYKGSSAQVTILLHVLME